MNDPAKRQGPIDIGDKVIHGPTGETWIVAYVRDGRVAWCGWPPGEASLADCTLKEQADDAQRKHLLQQMANMQSDDERRRYALHRLGAAPTARVKQLDEDWSILADEQIKRNRDLEAQVREARELLLHFQFIAHGPACICAMCEKRQAFLDRKVPPDGGETKS